MEISNSKHQYKRRISKNNTMTVTVKYFGILTDVTGINEEKFALDVSPISVGHIIEKVTKKYPLVCESNYRIAVNQSISSFDIQLSNNDIMALLPPFAGG
jgi:molybdopterin synthase sulfur carrier subunit